MPGQWLQSDDVRYYHKHGQRLHEQRVSKLLSFTVRNDQGSKEARRLCELGGLDTDCIVTVRVHGPHGWASGLLSATGVWWHESPTCSEIGRSHV